MTSERNRGRSWCTRALLAAASLTALAACSVRQQEANAQHEATASTVAALEATWTESPTIKRYRHAGAELDSGRALVCGGKGDTEDYPPTCELLQVLNGQLTSTVYPLPREVLHGVVVPGSAPQPRL